MAQLSKYPVTHQSYHSFRTDAVGACAAARNLTTSAANQAWRAAKRVVYVPFDLDFRYYVASLKWMNGPSVSGNVDAGIMDGSGNRLYHSGSTAMSGASTFQSVSPAFWLVPGRYYFALSADNTTASFRMAVSNVAASRASGLLQEDTSVFGIPTTYTPVAVTNGDIPYIMITDDTSLTF